MPIVLEFRSLFLIRCIFSVFYLSSEFPVTSVVNLWKSFGQSFSMKKLNTLCKSTTALDFQTVISVTTFLTVKLGSKNQFEKVIISTVSY